MKKIILLLALCLTMGCRLPSTINSLTSPTQALTPAPRIATITQTVSPSPTPTAKPTTCTVTAYVLNLRKGPSINTNIIDWLDRETELKIIGTDTDGNWYQVTTQTKQVGYVHSKYCKKEQ